METRAECFAGRLPRTECRGHQQVKAPCPRAKAVAFEAARSAEGLPSGPSPHDLQAGTVSVPVSCAASGARSG
jgi:hypothetical protein